MANAPLRMCSKPGCGNLTRQRRCEKHAKERREQQSNEAIKTYDERRGSARQRGYTKRWEKCRAAHLRLNPLCAECLKEGAVTAARLVDHIRPVQSADDPLFFEQTNWQSLCVPHHARKTARDKREGKTRPAL